MEFDPQQDEPDEELESIAVGAWNCSGKLLPLVLPRCSGRQLEKHHQLARALGPEQPVYSLGHGFGPESDGENPDLTAWKTHFLTLINGLDLPDRFIIGGWSFSGMMALEVADELAAAGREPHFVVLFDTRAPRPMTESWRVHLLYFGDNLMRWAALPTRSARRSFMCYKLRRPYQKLWARMTQRWIKDPDGEPVERRPRAHHHTDDPLTLAVRTLSRTWDNRQYDHRVLQLWTSLHRLRLGGDPSLGLASVFDGPFLCLGVEGDHHSMWEEDHVGSVANQLRSALTLWPPPPGS